MRFQSMYREYRRDQNFRNQLEEREAFLWSSLDDMSTQMTERRDHQRAMENEVRSAIAKASESSLETTCQTAQVPSSSFADNDFYQREEEERRRLAEMQSNYYLPNPQNRNQDF